MADKVIHFQIPAKDIDKVQDFYTEVFDWDMEKVPMPEKDYYIVTAAIADDSGLSQEAGAINGNIIFKDRTAKAPILVINVDSIDDTAAKVIRAGGKVVLAKHQVSDMGLYARIADPEGNVLGLWEDLE